MIFNRIKMDNMSQQADEIEAIQSIYEKEWNVENGDSCYSMQITKSVTLFITLHPDYPSISPPKYDLLAPEFSKQQKNKVQEDFDTIFRENMGNPILFQWIEKLKEIELTSKKQHNSAEKFESIIPDESKKIDGNKIDYSKFLKEVVHGRIIEDRRSVFQGHSCSVETEKDVRNFLDYLLENKKIAQATHNIYAYRVKKGSSILQDCEDDGENNASKRVLHLLQILNLENVAVVVSRWYGGIQLGPDRFKHITNAARQVLVQAGFIK